MRITIVTGPFCSLPPVGFGAVEKRWFDCGRYFAASGHEVTMLARRGESECGVEYIDGVRIMRAFNFHQSGHIAFDLVSDAMYSMCMSGKLPQADVTIVNSFWLPVLAPWHRSAGRIIYNVARFPKGQLGLYRKVDRLCFVSQAVYQAGINQCPSVADRSVVIPNPIRTDIYNNRGLAEHKGINVIYSGRIAAEKGLDILVRAFSLVYRKYPQSRLRLIGAIEIKNGGDGPSYLKKLLSLADDLPLEIVPAISDPTMLAAELRNGDVYVYPSCADRGESFGVAPLEAMAVGLPVVVSGLACFGDFISDGVNGLVFDHHSKNAVEELADKICLLISDKALCRRFGDKAAITASTFSVSQIAQRYIREFHRLVGA